jgi:uncharacterized protein (UPF0332 family)
MIDTPERALHEAESWLVSAKHSLVEAGEDEADANVCCAQAIHAIIRANDALCLKVLGHKATRHDDAATMFALLAREGRLPEGAKRLRDLVSNAMRDKSGADYGKRSFSLGNAKNYVEETEQFISMVKTALNL